ncbi:MAG: zinc ribbon domain-containing protein [Bacteroidota bacterium]
MKEMVLKPEFNLPKETSEVIGKDGKQYLQFNTSMATLYQQTYGEHSRFFFALKEARLIGSKCTKCGQVMVPAATWHCPMCNFAEMKEIELPHRGILAQTAPITIFPSTSFIGQAPFCRGYVDVATNAKVASFLPSRMRTTTGIPRPGIFVKGIELKLVFVEKRVGSILDIFWVPMSEISAKLRKKEPLFENEIDFESPTLPKIKLNKDFKPVYTSLMQSLKEMSANVSKSPRAQQNLAGKKYCVSVKTGGGDFTFIIKKSRMFIEAGISKNTDFTIVANDPKIFMDWIKDGSLTDAVVEGTLWLPSREAFIILPMLDRLPRSIRRDLF